MEPVNRKLINYDWEDLFARWVRSGMKKNDFLKSRGINPNGMIAKKKTDDWQIDVSRAASVLRKEDKESQLDKAIKATDLKVDPLPPIPQLKEIWQIVQQWRQKQAENDYRLADIIRLHCKILLKSAMLSKVDLEGKETITSSLKPNDLLSLAKVCETVQKIQRLALGLSTENIGVDRGIEVAENETVPVFEVQVNELGRFINVR
jgi:hypothetical protein